MNTKILGKNNIVSNHKNASYRGVISFALAFYVSYLFTHFVILELYEITDTWIILSSIFLGHMILNQSVLIMTKNRTFGDLFVKSKYVASYDKQNVYSVISFRSLIVSMMFYLAVYYIYLSGFNELAIVSGFIFVVICSGNFCKEDNAKLSVIDKLSGIHLASTN